jgi:hypothetical protein
MFTCILPSIDAVQSNNDARPTAGLRIAELRVQLALVRTLADHIDHLVRPRDIKAAREQLFEEMARLGCRLFETAAALAGLYPEDMGVFPDESPAPPLAEPCSRASAMA